MFQGHTAEDPNSEECRQLFKLLAGSNVPVSPVVPLQATGVAPLKREISTPPKPCTVTPESARSKARHLSPEQSRTTPRDSSKVKTAHVKPVPIQRSPGRQELDVKGLEAAAAVENLVGIPPPPPFPFLGFPFCLPPGFLFNPLAALPQAPIPPVPGPTSTITTSVYSGSIPYSLPSSVTPKRPLKGTSESGKKQSRSSKPRRDQSGSSSSSSSSSFQSKTQRKFPFSDASRYNYLSTAQSVSSNVKHRPDNAKFPQSLGEVQAYSDKLKSRKDIYNHGVTASTGKTYSDRITSQQFQNGLESQRDLKRRFDSRIESAKFPAGDSGLTYDSCGALDLSVSSHKNKVPRTPLASGHPKVKHSKSSWGTPEEMVLDLSRPAALL